MQICTHGGDISRQDENVRVGFPSALSSVQLYGVGTSRSSSVLIHPWTRLKQSTPLASFGVSCPVYNLQYAIDLRLM